MVVIGIDLGTTFSCVAWYRNGRPEIIQNQEGDRITPSVVGFTGNDVFVGKAARIEIEANMKDNIVYEAKRLIGRSSSDPSVVEDVKRYTFEVVLEPNMSPKYRIRDNGTEKLILPEEISKSVLEKLKSAAEDYTGEPIAGAVITVPAYFNSAQRTATVAAGKRSGLNVLRIINEPTAAGIAYAAREGFSGKKTVLVYDLGGGTFDVSILEMIEGEVNVLAVGGDTRLGGTDFDDRLFEHFTREVAAKLGANVKTNSSASRKLREGCEYAKRTLSGRSTATIGIEMLIENKNFKSEITRAKFEDLNRDLFEKTMDCVKETLKDAKLSPDGIEEILLVGGSTRIPKIQQLITEMFPKSKICKSISPDEAVAEGAAIVAAREEVLSLAKNQNESDSHPLQKLVISDVVSLSLGFEAFGGLVKRVVPRNYRIPTSVKEIFYNGNDYMEFMQFNIYQGERARAVDNLFVGSCLLKIDNPKRSGENEVEWTLSVDVNGILMLAVRDTDSGRMAHEEINYQANSLTRSTIENSIAVANDRKEEDDAEITRVATLWVLHKHLLRIKHDIEDDKCTVPTTMSKEEMEAKVKESIKRIDADWGMPVEEINAIEKEMKMLKIL